MSLQEDYFDVTWFNRLYVTWMQTVYKVTNDRGLVEQCDQMVVSEFGRRMAQEVKKRHPEFLQLSTIEGLYCAIRLTHWFQEDVKLIALNEKMLVLGVENCSWQQHWHKCHNEFYPQCIGPHKGFLESFCKEWGDTFVVKTTKQPDADGCCSWEVTNG